MDLTLAFSKVALVNIFIGYNIQFVSFYTRNYISFVRQRISFPDQRKYLNSVTSCDVFEYNVGTGWVWGKSGEVTKERKNHR